MMSAMDLNGDGQIEFSEFIAGCSSFEEANVMVTAELIFNIIDKDQSGRMDYEEFKKFFSLQNIKFEGKDIEKIFSEMDEDNDGTIDVLEFGKKFKTYFE